MASCLLPACLADGPGDDRTGPPRHRHYVTNRPALIAKPYTELPLGVVMDDAKLKAKVQPWVEWTLTHQAKDGYLGPIPFEQPPKREPGLQRGKRRDWWPKMVMLKILQNYYGATGDKRVIECLSKYFHYQLRELPKTPLASHRQAAPGGGPQGVCRPRPPLGHADRAVRRRRAAQQQRADYRFGVRHGVRPGRLQSTVSPR